MRISIVETGKVVFEKAVPAGTFSSRLRGLMGVKGLGQGECLVIIPCSSIHTFFMKFDIDVVFLDNNFRVLRIEKRIKPGKMIMPVKGARYVVESDSRWDSLKEINEGNILEFIKD